MSPNLKTSTSLIAVLALAGALGVAWWVQRPPATATTKSAAAAQPGVAGGAPARAAVVVETAPVRRQAVADDVEAVGSLRSRQGTVVRAEVAGRVVQIGFRDGQKVVRGQFLVQLDDRLQQAQLQQAQAELSIAQANHRRNTELVAQGFISQRGLDESAAAVKVAQAKAELARATAARLRVLAPFDGVAGLRNISVGDYLKDGADIVNLEDMNAMYVDFRLPERWQARVRPGQSARVQVEALPERAFAAVVQAVDPQIDANGRSLIVRGCIDNRRLQLRPGMFARVAARLGDDRAALMIPEQAVVSQGGRQSVYRLVKAEGPEGTPAWRGERVDVQTGVRLAGLVEIVQGLAEGERVVTAGQQRIQGDGALLRVADTSAAATPAAPAASSAAVAWAETLPGPSPCGAAPAR
ncbi:efflux RND transporter periplasmic adaptor subunit [Ottowia pentelensis]|uniref:Efflux RND transporter periplasmic adaptor subunit n=1 Tax=Ottowia pentelensis TaxID=511108 RepID=A0ABV6PWV0_9BURK